jgi:magnesium chelatase family protein
MQVKDERRRILLVGPPGSPFIERAREISRECRLWQGRESEQGYAWKVAGVPRAPDVFAPLRAPHHTVSRQAVEGKLDGHRWQPGEVHLAHGGVLYLDQAPEFRMDVLEILRAIWTLGRTSYLSRRRKCLAGDEPEPSERNHLYVPAVFTLVMSAAPCPCGGRGVEGKSCRCQDRQVDRWFERIRGLTEGAERENLSAVAR